MLFHFNGVTLRKFLASLIAVVFMMPGQSYAARQTATAQTAVRNELRTDLGPAFVRNELRTANPLSWKPYTVDDDEDEKFLFNLRAYGLKVQEIQYADLGNKPEAIPFKTIKSKVAFGIIQAQALAAINYSGIAEGKDKSQGSIAKKEGDASAVSAGVASIRQLAEAYDVRIIVIGNEGATRDESAAIPVLNVYNRNGKNGTFLFLNDSVEGTNYMVKGLPGSWAIIALLDEGNVYSTDGYRISVNYRANRPAAIDPLIYGDNTLEKVFGEIAKANNEQTLEDWLADKHVVILGDRKRHDGIIGQLQELSAKGLTFETIPDGDFVPRTLQSAFGVRTRNGREVIVIGAGGANEHKMALAAAALTKPDEEGRKGFAVSRYITHGGLKDDLVNADHFTPDEVEEFGNLNQTIQTKGLPVGIQPENYSAIETEAGIIGKSVVAAASITGARSADFDRYREDLGNVTFVPSADQPKSGTVAVDSFLIDEDGNPFLIKTTYQTQDLLATRLSLLSNNLFHPGGDSLFYHHAAQLQKALDELENFSVIINQQSLARTEVVDRFIGIKDILDQFPAYFLTNNSHNILASELLDLETIIQADPNNQQHFYGKAADVKEAFENVTRQVIDRVLGVPVVNVDGRQLPVVAPKQDRNELRVNAPYVPRETIQAEYRGKIAKAEDQFRKLVEDPGFTIHTSGVFGTPRIAPQETKLLDYLSSNRRIEELARKIQEFIPRPIKGLLFFYQPDKDQRSFSVQLQDKSVVKGSDDPTIDERSGLILINLDFDPIPLIQDKLNNLLTERQEVRKITPELIQTAESVLSKIEIPEVTVESARGAKAVISNKANPVLIADSKFALEEGGLALLPTLSGNNPSVVIVEDAKGAAFVEKFNAKVPVDRRIAIAYSAEEAVKLLQEKIKDQIGLLGGTKPGAFQIRGLVADPSSAAADALRKQLGDDNITVVTPGLFNRIAQKAGLLDFVDTLQTAYTAFTKSA